MRPLLKILLPLIIIIIMLHDTATVTFTLALLLQRDTLDMLVVTTHATMLQPTSHDRHAYEPVTAASRVHDAGQYTHNSSYVYQSAVNVKYSGKGSTTTPPLPARQRTTYTREKSTTHDNVDIS